MAKEVNRRDFLKKSLMGSIAAGVAIYGLDKMVMRPKSAVAAGLALNSHEYATVAAVAAQIIPSEPQHAGATEANVVTFIDNALSDVTDYKQSSQLPAYSTGVANLDAVSNSAYGKNFEKLTNNQQIAILQGCEDGVYGASLKSFFTLINTHSWEGFFSRPDYGGNKLGSGWAAIGYVPYVTHKIDFGGPRDGGCYQCHDFGNPDTLAHWLTFGNQ